MIGELYVCNECQGTGLVVGYNRDGEPESYTCEACGGEGDCEDDDGE